MANTIDIRFQIDQDASGRTTLKQIDRQVDEVGASAKKTGSQLDSVMSVFKGTVLADYFRQGAAAAVQFGISAVNAFNEAQAASLGLASVAKFKGIGADTALAAVKDLDLVKSGLLSVADASETVKNFLKSGMNLDQAIALTQRFGDAAAFGKSSTMSFGDAIKSASQGVATQSSELLNNVSIVTNMSAFLERAGFTLDDLTSKTKGAAANQALYNGLMGETADAVGNASKITGTFAGQQALLDAAQNKLLVTLGELITKNPELNNTLKSISDSIEHFTLQLQDSDSEVSKFVVNTVNSFAIIVDAAAKLTHSIGAILAIVNLFPDLSKILNPGALLNPVSEDEAKQAAIIKKQFTQLRQLYAAEQKKLEKEIKTAPTFDAEAQAAGQKTTDEINKANEAYFAKREQANKAFADGINEITDKTAELQAKLSTNPLLTLYDQAIIKQQVFLEKFRSLPQEMLTKLTALSTQAAALDFFKGALTQGQTLTSNLNEQAKLEAGFGGADLKNKKLEDDLALEERKLELIKQGVNLRGLASRKEIEHQALLFELESKRAAGTLSNAEQAILLRKIELSDKKFAGEDKLKAFTASALDANIQNALNFLAKADDDVQKQFANQQILGLTSDVGNLTPSQVEARQKALASEITLNQAAAKENSDRLKAQVVAQKDNTSAITQMITKFTTLEAALTTFKEATIVKVIDDSQNATVSVAGRSYQ